MALSDLILKKDELIITQILKEDAPVLDNSSLIYASVEAISQLQDLYAVGDIILVDASNAIQFTFDGIFYSLITTNAVNLIVNL